MLVLFLTIIVSTIIIYKIYQKLSLKMYDADIIMTDIVVIVTGANTGIGFATAEELAKCDAKVILACRDTQKGLAARDKIIKTTGNKNVIFKPLDLSSFKSVQEFADEILRTEPKLDVLINNAGTPNLDNRLTPDNLPIETQVNHFSPFLLTILLLPLLKSSAPSRIINVASLMHNFGTIDWLDKQATNCFQRTQVYCNTKLANILFTKKLSEKLKGTGVTVNSLHPGSVRTEIVRHLLLPVKLVLNMLFVTPQQGAQTSIFLAVDPSLKSVTGKYFSNCREVAPSKIAQDDEAAEKLWQMSESIVFGDKKAKLIKCLDIYLNK